MFNPLTKRKILRIIPFGIIWLLTGWLMMLIETIAIGNTNPNPGVTIALTWPVIIFASLAVLMVGLMVGTIEMFWLERYFRNKSFGRKLLYRFLVYSLLMLIIILITYPIAASLEEGVSPVHPIIWERLRNFLISVNFFSTGIQMAFSLFLCFFYLGISESVGDRVLINFFTGKYHKPKEEERIFMFLDMRSSTTVAEKLGNYKYFNLLKDYYDDLSESIIQFSGEVYQYVGDEIVISWSFKKGTQRDNCIRCFYAMKDALSKKKAFYLKKYGTCPEFKAGIHSGKVTTGEIGALKKDIFYTGDVLNVTSRIQNLCNKYEMELIVSEQLANLLMLQGFDKIPLGMVEIRGRKATLPIFGLTKQH
jgi:adenylate cyclase